MTVPSYAERARQFLAERSRETDGGCEQSDESHQSLPRLDLSSLCSLLSQPESGSTAPTPHAMGREESDESDQKGDAPTEGVWWDDRLPTGSAPILCLPPRTCFAPRACARLGPCVRHAVGVPCLVRP